MSQEELGEAYHELQPRLCSYILILLHLLAMMMGPCRLVPDGYQESMWWVISVALLLSGAMRARCADAMKFVYGQLIFAVGSTSCSVDVQPAVFTAVGMCFGTSISIWHRMQPARVCGRQREFTRWWRRSPRRELRLRLLALGAAARLRSSRTPRKKDPGLGTCRDHDAGGGAVALAATRR